MRPDLQSRAVAAGVKTLCGFALGMALFFIGAHEIGACLACLGDAFAFGYVGAKLDERLHRRREGRFGRLMLPPPSEE